MGLPNLVNEACVCVYRERDTLIMGCPKDLASNSNPAGCELRLVDLQQPEIDCVL